MRAVGYLLLAIAWIAVFMALAWFLVTQFVDVLDGATAQISLVVAR